MQRLTALVILAFFIGCGQKQESIDMNLYLPTVKADYQRKIVGQLAGEYPIADDVRLRSRWSAEERAAAMPYLKNLLLHAGLEPIDQSYKAANLNPAIDLLIGPFSGTNIYGILPATNSSSEYVILGAHYDTGKRNAPGADDNATGIALVYTVIKELSTIKNRTKNLLVVFFDQEEEELIGSQAFIDLIRDQQWDIHSVHCFDMVGWDGDKDHVYQLVSPSQDLIDLYKKIADGHNININEKHINAEGYEASSTDYDVFISEGFQVAGFGECFYCRDYSPYKDSPEDTFDKVNFEYLLAGTNLVEEVITKIITE